MTETKQSTRYVNPLTMLHAEAGHLAEDDLFGGELPEAFDLGEAGTFYRLTPELYCYLRVCMQSIKASVEKGVTLRSVYDRMRLRFLAHHQVAESCYTLPGLKAAASAFCAKTFILPRSVGDWGRKLGKPLDAAAPPPSAEPVEQPEAPGDPQLKPQRVAVVRETLDHLGRRYTPGCLAWFKTNHPDLYAALQDAEVHLEQQVSGGTLKSTTEAAEAYLRQWRTALSLFGQVHEHGRCPWCGAKMTGDPPYSGTLALEAAVK